MIDLLFLVFIIIAAGAGYLGGGFKELVKLSCLIFLIGLYSLPSVKNNIISITGPELSYVVILGSFVVIYFISQKLLSWVMSSLISHREGALGALNKGTGVFFGVIKSMAVILFLTALIIFLWERGVLVELREKVNSSIVFSLMSSIVKIFS